MLQKPHDNFLSSATISPLFLDYKVPDFNEAEGDIAGPDCENI
jgi:hypothetical protein